MREKLIARPRRDYVDDEICELIFHNDWRTVRNAFQNNGVYRNLLNIMKSECAVELEGKYYVVNSGDFRFAIESERFENMYLV